MNGMNSIQAFTKLSGLVMLGPRGELGQITDTNAFQLDGPLTRKFATYNVQFIKNYAEHLDDHRFRVGIIYRSKRNHPWGAETLTLTDSLVRMLYPVTGTTPSELTTFQKKNRVKSVYRGMELLLEYSAKDAPDVPILCPVIFNRNTQLSAYQSAFGEELAGEDMTGPVIEVLNLIGPVAGNRQNLIEFAELKQTISQHLIKKDARKSIELSIMQSGRHEGDAAGATPATVRAPTPGFATATAAAAPGRPAPAASPPPPGRGGLWYDPSWDNATCQRLARWLSSPTQYPELEEIRRFSRLRDMNINHLRQLTTTCPVYQAGAGSVLLEIGSQDNWNLYLIEGEIELQAGDGGRRTLSASSEAAANPIASLKPRQYTVNAKSPVRFLWLCDDHLAQIQRQATGSSFDLV
jgi:hypothetical protein